MEGPKKNGAGALTAATTAEEPLVDDEESISAVTISFAVLVLVSRKRNCGGGRCGNSDVSFEGGAAERFFFLPRRSSIGLISVAASAAPAEMT